jgi:translocator protein
VSVPRAEGSVVKKDVHAGWLDLLKLAAAIAVSQSAGVIGSLAAGDGMTRFYEELDLPPLTPPSWVFGPVWITLYTLMGIAAWLVWRRGWRAPGVRPALLVFLAQLVLNAGWTIVFFGANAPGWAALEIAALAAAVVATTLLFWRVHRVAGLLLLPYLVWVLFAGYLTVAIWRLN